MKTKKLKVLAVILLTSTILLLTAGVSIPSVKATTTTTLFLYTTLGLSSVTANGTTMTPGASTTLNSGNTYQFKATASTGWQFVCFVYADKTGPAGSTLNPYSKVISNPCSLEAVFIPTTNTTGTSSGTGASTLTLFASGGGTTSPAVPSTDISSGLSISGTIGHTTTITETPGTGYTFLCWVVQCTSANNYYTSSTLSYTPITSGAAIEPIWVPTSSAITLPTPTPTKIAEFSSLMVIILAAALVATALGTYAYAKRAKK
ncbi:MAG TPA: hypothetical protein VK536_01915 [Candidatus Limnocylindrales bacterium]|nr:hypothetical protein [Candidatus Limnocylindrales bacterium]